MNTTVLLICLIALIAAVVLEKLFKFPLGLTCWAAAFIISYFAFGQGPEAILSYFPTSVVVPMIFCMIYFSAFSSNGTIDILSRYCVRLMKGNLKLYPFVLFVISTALHFVFGAGPLRYTLTPIVISLASAAGGTTGSILMGLATIYLSMLMGTLNPYIGLSANTRPGQLEMAGVQGVAPVSLAMWLNSMVPLLILLVFMYLVTRGWKVPNIPVDNKGGKIEVNAQQKKSLYLLLVTVLIFVVPAALRSFVPTPFTKSLASLANNYLVFLLLILAAIALRLGDWRSMVTKSGMDLVLMVAGVTFLVGTAQKAGLQEFFTNSVLNAPQWLVAPVFVLIAAFLSFFMSGITLGPLLYPIAVALANSPAQMITYLSCACLGAAVSGVSPISLSGAAMLAVAPEQERDRYFRLCFLLAFIFPIVTAIIAALGGMGLFSGFFAAQM